MLFLEDPNIPVDFTTKHLLKIRGWVQLVFNPLPDDKT